MDKGSNFSPTDHINNKGDRLTGGFRLQHLSQANVEELQDEVFESCSKCQLQEMLQPSYSTDVVTSAPQRGDDKRVVCGFVVAQTEDMADAAGLRCHNKCLTRPCSISQCPNEGRAKEDVTNVGCQYRTLTCTMSGLKTWDCAAARGGKDSSPKCKLKALPFIRNTGPDCNCTSGNGSKSTGDGASSGLTSPEWWTRKKEETTKRNSLTVPQQLPTSFYLTKSSSLTNLNSSNTPAHRAYCRDRAISVPSSPDSFYCDSMYSSNGTVSIDLNCPSLARSLSCGALHAEMSPESVTPMSGARPRRSNSSDSAVELPSEEERTPFLKACKLYVHLQQHLQPSTQVLIDSPQPSTASIRDQFTFLSTSSSSDRSPFQFFNTPSVVVSDHSDQDCISLPYPEDFPSLDESLCGDSSLCWHSSRKLSDCSTCSLASSLSVDDDDLDDTQKSCIDTDKSHQPSGWKKVRNIVHWSPFVQTYKKQKYPWVQLAGHQGSFKAGDQGTILKKLCPKEEKCLLRLMKDDLFNFVPHYKGQVEGDENEKFLQLQDLLKDFDNPCVMDCKIGVRTYLEEELAKAKEKSKLRKDMYDKMVQVDPSAPTEEENRLKGVTKPRYMVWRETISSTATLGFRIEGMKRGNGISSKDFKLIRTKDQVTNSIKSFLDGFEHVLPQYIQRLKDLKKALIKSEFFRIHELIGSSLLFVHDSNKASVWMIDFAKTQPLPDGIKIDHKSPWVVGNHEDGYLIGVENLIQIFTLLESKHHCHHPYYNSKQ